jgi:glycosyltransferase involved in cell wall biosynthesis
VTLTQASVPQITDWLAGRDVPITVIPTCVDEERFGSTRPRDGGPRTVWCGSVGTWYRFDLAVQLARSGDLPLTVLTRQVEEARREAGAESADIRSVSPGDVPGELHEGDIGLCLVVRLPSKRASTPTRFAEFLAAGMPVAVTPGVGDMEAIVRRHGVGVIVEDETPDALRDAVNKLRALAADDATRRRCRELAREEFGLDGGVARYRRLYEEVIGAAAASRPV